ncbi:MAG: aspartate/tyrosine/aromatic aminotransferase [Rhodobacterales bacterium]|jgi:aromatic-amino-acid transaminase|nr:aspartate/tyrosine/aromatic aminotransferase [Rhodobacterales bacterium]NCX27660.1 aspartate/tyrosine/aromatic aminotransferase [Rhodobacterales bacterium]
MFNSLQQQPADKILALMQVYKEDPRENKIDLGVGVYKDASGQTPIMQSIKQAEHMLWETQNTKSYVGLTGTPEFSQTMIDLVLGNKFDKNLTASAATPGGTGAVRQAFELGKMANPNLRVFVSDPTWPNHLSILKYLGIPVEPYRYFDAKTRAVDFSSMMTDLENAKEGDLILLHGCCHNPTGANLKAPEWDAVIELLLKSGATPMIDIAYQGFGDGLEEDASGVRKLVSSVPETIIAASCSKNFGIYRERTGLLIVVSHDKDARDLNQSTLAFLNRQNFSFPPDHGARLVTMVLSDEELKRSWMEELEAVRTSMLSLRTQLATELEKLSGSNRFGFLADHRGMFSRLGASPEQVNELRENHAVYMVGDSRLNIAGLNSKTVPVLAKAIVDCGI